MAAIRRAGSARPADAALREVLASLRPLAPSTSADASKLVFHHYRWLGWTRGERRLESKLHLARELARAFADCPDRFPTEELRVKAIPAWVADHLEVNDDWLRTLQTEPVLWLRAKRGTGTAVARSLGAAQAHPLPDAIRYDGEADLFRSEGFRGGEFEIQDLTSQLVGWLCHPQPGETWWDAWAGEGGKTLHLSELMANRGLIWASDRAAWRLQVLKRRAARARVFNYRCALWDGKPKLPTNTKFDGVLLDAPCSGLGTWQRNPHARWTTTPADVVALAGEQARLLANVAAAVKPGGRLIYSVCTLTHAETTAVVDGFDSTQPHFVPEAFPLNQILSKMGRAISDAARVTLVPATFDSNGMYVAAWRCLD